MSWKPMLWPALLSAVLVTGCWSSDSETSQDAEANLSGDWHLYTGFEAREQFIGVMSLDHNLSNIDGLLSWSSGEVDYVVGSIRNRRFTGTIIDPFDVGWYVEFELHVEEAGGRLTGTAEWYEDHTRWLWDEPMRAELIR